MMFQAKIARIIFSKRATAFLLMAYFQLAYGASVIWYYHEMGINSLIASAKDVLVSSTMVYMMFFALLINRWVYVLTVPFLFITSALTSFFIYFYKILPNSDNIGLFFNTKSYEAREMISQEMLWYCSCSMVAGLLVCTVFYKQYFVGKNPSSFKTSMIECGLPLIAVFAAAYYPYMSAVGYREYVPFDYLSGSSRYFIEHAKMLTLDNKRQDISLAEYHLAKPLKNTKIVIVIGEAARSDHFGFNGYPRNTTPYLNTLKNSVTFKDVIACSNQTTVSVPCMLTRGTRGNPNVYQRETSLISIFNRLGFTSYWVTNQNLYDGISTPVTLIAEEANHKISGAGRLQDEVLIEKLHEILAGNTDNQLIVLHMVGSHFFYDWRYPEAYKKFMPTCQKVLIQGCTRDEVNNSYDNTILYTDYVVHAIVGELEQQHAFMVFIPDHGESLGENGIYFHGDVLNRDLPEQMYVPMLWWFSSSYLGEYPRILDKMKRVKANTAHISHSYVFHSLLGCAGLSSEMINETLDLCH